MVPTRDDLKPSPDADEFAADMESLEKRRDWRTIARVPNQAGDAILRTRCSDEDHSEGKRSDAKWVVHRNSHAHLVAQLY